MFNIDTLANREVNTFNVFEATSVEETFSLSTLNFLEERAREYRECTKELYKSILESNQDYDVINESFSDFFTKVKEIIDKFIKFIKSLFDRFITALNKFVLSDKHLKKHAEDFRKFGSAHEFSMDGYTFSFDPYIPAIEAQAAFDRSFVDLDFAEIGKITDNLKRADAIGRKYTALTNDLKSDWYDKFRGVVIGKGSNYAIGAGEFANELFCIYRNGESTKDSLTVTSSLVSEAHDRFMNHKEYQKETKKTKDTIEREYENIKKQVQSMIYRNRDNDINKLVGIGVDPQYDSKGGAALVVSSEVITKIDLFVKAKVNQIMEMSNIHSMAFSYKLDAIADCFRQDKQLLYTALNKIQKDIKA